ncbi:MAG: hypothetical protein O3B65_02985 [Chloroflexi bacterium]|nr:hypothetical protein [Chloroflexota bacterium]
MPTGNTITATLADSLPTVVTQARLVRETKGTMSQLADRVTLGEGVGNDWKEISLAKLTASVITETTEEDNPQQLSDSAFSITPSVISVHTVISDRADRNVSKNVMAKIGPLGQNAIERKKNQDGLVTLDGASVIHGGQGPRLQPATSLPQSNALEPTLRRRGTARLRSCFTGSR